MMPSLARAVGPRHAKQVEVKFIDEAAVLS